MNSRFRGILFDKDGTLLDFEATWAPLFRGLASDSYVYFVHSFFPKPADSSIVATRTTYGEILTLAGRFDEAVAQLNLARLHDPLSAAVHLALSLLLAVASFVNSCLLYAYL